MLGNTVIPKYNCLIPPSNLIIIQRDTDKQGGGYEKMGIVTEWFNTVNVC